MKRKSVEGQGGSARNSEFYFGFYTTHDQFLPLLQNPHLTGRINLIRRIMKRLKKV